LKVTKLLAFGDSLTEGRIAVSRTQLVVVPGSYPDRLQRLLAARYGNQTIEVYNEGRAGEWAQDGLTRFASVVRELRPEVVILLEGANDLAAQGQRGISRAEGAIESMVKEARNRGAAVILAGLPPQASNSTSADLVRDYNIRMREVARDEQVTFVDLFAAFGSRADTGLIGPDGLHPTPSGYERMAQTFFDVIRAVFEVSPAALTTTRR
jgi:lysophospholipase L1-like esterase